MNCIIIDDEELAITVLRDHIGRIPHLRLLNSTTSALEAIGMINQLPVDLIFLDIQMPDLTGIELLNSLNRHPLIIFTTAYPEYALESYQFDCVDYLVKPIPFDRFLKAINKASQRLTPAPIQVITNATESKTENDYIFVKTEYKTVRIDLSTIYYIESQKDYVIFHAREGQVASLINISTLEKELPSGNFIRIHRSFIIALDKISEIERNTVITKGDRLQVGVSYREVFRKVVNIHRLGFARK